MKNFRKKIMTVLLAIGCAMAFAAVATPTPQSNMTNTNRSIFILPSNPREGRDPFFPDSTRPYKLATSAAPQVADVASLVVKGFSGSVDRRLVIINNHTFAARSNNVAFITDGKSVIVDDYQSAVMKATLLLLAAASI
ncbi:MAG: hypothetical protein ACLPRE_03690 [Limisphaerales bacterium]